MFVGRYRFTGPVEELLAAHDRLLASMPPGQVVAHLCLRDEEGITVLDACPDREVFVAFSRSRDFAAAVAAAGLPPAVVEPLGELVSWILPAARRP